MTENSCGIDTRLQHPRIGAASGGEPVSPPVYQSSTYVLPTPELGAEIAASWHPQRFYTRYGSPNVALVEAIVADLEGAESAVAVGSGMAAIAAAIRSNVRAGDHVVAQTAHYTAALTLLTEWLPRQGVEVTQVDQTDIEAFRHAIGPRTRLVYTEKTPTNPTMAVTDLETVSALARAQGAIVVTDNTFASSFNELPLTLGVDLVVHSATKYLNGHSDVTAGVVAGVAEARRAGLGIRPCAWSCAASDGSVLARARAQDLCAASAPAQSIRGPSGRSACQGERHREGPLSRPGVASAARTPLMANAGWLCLHVVLRGRGTDCGRTFQTGSNRVEESAAMYLGGQSRWH